MTTQRFQFITFRDLKYRVDLETRQMWVIRDGQARAINWVGPTAFAIRKLIAERENT